MSKNLSFLDKCKSRLSFFKKGNREDDEDQLFKNVNKGRQEPFIGSKTETALLSLARLSLGLQPGELQYLRDQPMEKFNIEKVVQTIPFESSRKWAGLVVKYKEGKNKNHFTGFSLKVQQKLFPRIVRTRGIQMILWKKSMRTIKKN